MPRTCPDDSDYVIRADDANRKTARLVFDIHPDQARMLDYLVRTKQCRLATTDAWLGGPFPVYLCTFRFSSEHYCLVEAKMNIFSGCKRFEA